MFFTHLSAGSFRENISHAEQGWANPSRINELEVPEPSGGSAQGPALPCSSQPALFSSSRLIYAHRQAACSASLWITEPSTKQPCSRAAGVAGMMKRHVLVQALPGTGRSHNGCAGEKEPGQAQPSQAAGKSPQSGQTIWGKKGFYGGAGKRGLERLQLSYPCPPTGPLQPPLLPKALLLLESPEERNGKVRQRQMQRTDKK